MVDVRSLDVYSAAYLAGGHDRVVDTAVVALWETGQVRAQSSGQLCVVKETTNNPVEAAVLTAIGSQGDRNISAVRRLANDKVALQRLEDRLLQEGLVGPKGLSRLFGPGATLGATALGRRLLRDLRHDTSVLGGIPGSSTVPVALDGPIGLSDTVVRDSVFASRTPRNDKKRDRKDESASGATFWGGWGGGGHSGGAHGCGSSGGSSCGGGGGGGCGGGS